MKNSSNGQDNDSPNDDEISKNDEAEDTDNHPSEKINEHEDEGEVGDSSEMASVDIEEKPDSSEHDLKKKERVLKDEDHPRKPPSNFISKIKQKMGPFLDNKYARFIILTLSIYVFILSIETIGSGFKNLGSDFSEGLISTMSDPISALFIGMLATACIQSSSATTSIIVAMVATGTLPFEVAIPAIMGANIGTTVTNTLVSLGHIRRKEEFRRAFAGSTCHDMFNILAVFILLPIELIFHPLKHIATGMAGLFEGAGGLKFVSPLKAITKPVVGLLKDGIGISFSGWVVGVIMIIIGIVILFIALKIIVDTMRQFMMRKAEILINKYLFKAPIYAFLLGAGLTAAIQSSSIATSLMVPLVGAGILTVEKKFPYTMGTNLGTTVTALLAALGLGAVAGLQIAFAHFMFNLIAICIIYPMRKIPIGMALKLGDLGAERKRVVLIYIVCTFYILPFIYLILAGVL
jgi:sodium-dependent phosphate cotransporter